MNEDLQRQLNDILRKQGVAPERNLGQEEKRVAELFEKNLLPEIANFVQEYLERCVTQARKEFMKEKGVSRVCRYFIFRAPPGAPCKKTISMEECPCLNYKPESRLLGWLKKNRYTLARVLALGGCLSTIIHTASTWKAAPPGLFIIWLVCFTIWLILSKSPKEEKNG